MLVWNWIIFTSFLMPCECRHANHICQAIFSSTFVEWMVFYLLYIIHKEDQLYQLFLNIFLFSTSKMLVLYSTLYLISILIIYNHFKIKFNSLCTTFRSNRGVLFDKLNRSGKVENWHWTNLLQLANVRYVWYLHY